MNVRLQSTYRRVLLCAACLALEVGVIAQRKPAARKPAPPVAPAVVQLTLSAACTGLHGPYVHAWVTIADVQAWREEDGSWQDLTPDLTRRPLQVDLLGATDANGFLATLGSNGRLPVGRYAEIRLFLAEINPTPTRLCTIDSPCVVLQIGGVVPLISSPDSTNGAVIGPDRIAGGVWNVRPGRTNQLTLFWNACASIVPESNYQFRLAPVLHASGTSATVASIRGRIVDPATDQPLAGGNVMVALEYPDAAGVDRVAMVTNADGNGTFQFSSVPEHMNEDTGPLSRWDLVVAAIDDMNAAYAPVVITDVMAGSDVGEIALPPLPASNTAPAALFGEAHDAGAATDAPAVVTVSALLPVNTGNGAIAVTMPLMQQGQSNAMVLVRPDPMNCPSGIACGRYTLVVPAQGAQVGVWHAELERIVWTEEPTVSTTYLVEATRAAGTLSECEITETFEAEATPGSLQRIPDFVPPACR